MITESRPTVCTLDSPAALDPDVAGTKAAALAWLRARGERVPAGVVLTVRPASGPEPAEGVDALLDHLDPDVEHAVRSSSPDEDLAGRSYAGQYLSVLGVRGRQDLTAAIHRCRDSAAGRTLEAYAGAPPRGIAVLVQQMVDARVAGVAFSVDPVSGDPASSRVAAVHGIAEGLAAGRETPEEWTVTAQGASCAGEDAVLDAPTAVRVARTVERIADLRGGPQDMEWAIDGDGELWILQARPVTGLPGDRDLRVPPGCWTRAHNAQRPLSALQRSLVVPPMNRTVTSMFAFSMTAGITFEVIGGWLYTRHLPLDPADLGGRIGELVEAASSGTARAVVDRCYDEEIPALRWALDELDDAAASSGTTAPSGTALLSALDEADRVRERALEIHFRATGAQMFLLGRLGALCDELVGWDVDAVLALVVGLPGLLTGPTEELASVAARGDGAELDDAVGEFLRRHGRRTTAFDIDEPTLAERPDLVRRSVLGPDAASAAGARRRSAEDRRRAAETELSAALERAGRGASDRAGVADALADAQHAHPVRDDTDVYRYAAEARVRYAALAVGRRLADLGVVDTVDDVFHLERDELPAALDGTPQHTRVAERARERAQAEANPPPHRLGEPPAPDGAAGRGPAPEPPEAVRRAIAAAVWTWAAFAPAGPGPGDDGAADGGPEGGLRGVAASAGVARGPARIVRCEADLDRVHPGDVLVCTDLSAQWAFLFDAVVALVTDVGGILSHPAIVAREFGVPAVVATSAATSMFHDGQDVVVDGSTGVVRPAEAG